MRCGIMWMGRKAYGDRIARKRRCSGVEPCSSLAVLYGALFWWPTALKKGDTFPFLVARERFRERTHTSRGDSL